jgi:hypothetical protein
MPEVRRLMAEGKMREARILVREAYPFGERTMWPYKMWTSSVRVAFPGLYPKRKPEPIQPVSLFAEERAIPEPGPRLFEEEA